MSSAPAPALWRPGVVQGPQPERPDRDDPWPVRAVRAVEGWLRVPRRAGRREVAAFARAVDDAASGLDALADAELDRAAATLRAELRTRGLRPALVPRGFALVREVARRSLGTPHFDVQLYGARVMLDAGLAELETGEGKTLTATLPAALAALAGVPVHVVTANDYLVERDAAAMRPLYERLGLRCGVVVEARPHRDERRAAYACDVVYVTAKQVAFDYLQDRLARAGAERPVLRGLCLAIVDEADSVLVDEARTPLILSRPGAPADADTAGRALALARELEAERHYRIDRRHGRVTLLDAGRERLAALARDATGALAGAHRRAAWVERALAAVHLFERDRHYLVRDDRIEIIDLPTGRRAPDRAFEADTQTLIELKEALAPTPQRETVARISYQRFFRRYLRLAGMTGTAREVARELFAVYGMRTVSVPTRLPSRRRSTGPRVFARSEDRWGATLERVATLHAARRPVLVGTESLAASERLRALLADAGLAHQVLSARQDREEARVVGRAGEAGRITVATRMAGRGTDIRLGPGVAERGGLAVLATELAEAGRIDRQLFGRCARQGAPGSHEQLASLEDPIARAHLPAWLRRLLSSGFLHTPLPLLFMRYAQRAEEKRCALARRRLLRSERAIAELLGFAGRAE